MPDADLDHHERGPTRGVTRGRTSLDVAMLGSRESRTTPLCLRSPPESNTCASPCDAGGRGGSGGRHAGQAEHRAAHVRTGATRLIRRDGVPRAPLLGPRRCTTTGPPAGVAADLWRTPLEGRVVYAAQLRAGEWALVEEWVDATCSLPRKTPARSRRAACRAASAGSGPPNFRNNFRTDSVITGSGRMQPDNDEGPPTDKHPGQRPFSLCGRCRITTCVGIRRRIYRTTLPTP
jgi:hypothetical protein